MRQEDKNCLEVVGLPWSTEWDGNMLSLLIEGWEVPPGMTPATTTLLVRLAPTFNDVGPDMFWCDPPVTFEDGTSPAATEVRNTFGGRSYQRWSRHIGPHWRPGVDNVGTYLGYVRRAMAQEVEVNS